jgi:sigma-B regulation protein RsbU (phosphoserine phosphatase)
MDAVLESTLRDELLDRRRRLAGAVREIGQAEDLVRLMLEVDAALARMDGHAYGLCSVCHKSVEEEFLEANPAITYCLCNLTPEQQRHLERDLELATHIQLALLPRQDLAFAGWQTHYRYRPAGPVSGDYCDLLTLAREDEETLYFLLGDVSGKGVAAALLMAHLNAMFRSLVDSHLPLREMVERANRLLAGSTTAAAYATLVAGRADRSGRVELCNAGHCPPLVLRDGAVASVAATGMPLGLFARGVYGVQEIELAPGDTLFLYTDGLTEARDAGDVEYGAERLARSLQAHRGTTLRALADGCLRDHVDFLGGAPEIDDLTILAIHRA